MNIASPQHHNPFHSLCSLAGRFLTPMVLLIALSSSTQASEGSFRHDVLMRGQILENEAGTLVVCVGTKDGAEVGQVLNVIRHIRGAHQHKSSTPRFRREAVGSVRITKVFDEHYAIAEVVEGEAQVNDTVELSRR